MEMKLEMVLMKKVYLKVYWKDLTGDKCEVMQLRDIFFLQNYPTEMYSFWNCTVDVRPCCKNKLA